MAKAVLQPSDFVYEGYRNVQTNGEASTYGKALTHRYVGSQLRFLTLSHDGKLMEFTPGPLGSTVTNTTQTWQLPNGLVDDFTGIWWEEAKQRLWVTRTLDYGDASSYYPTRISVLTLGNGSVSNVKTFSLSGVSSKKVFGGAQKLTPEVASELGLTNTPYVVGFGGYTSLVDQTSKASVGPAMFAIPDPDTINNGATLSAGQFRTLLDAYGSRGYRATPVNNQVDDATWRGQNPAGSYWMTWNDSYYNTGMMIEGATKQGYASILTVGTGTVSYGNGGVQVDGQGFEMHVWDQSRLDDGVLTRPDSMTRLDLPRGNTRTWGDYGVGKITGATYDAVSGRMYLIGFPFSTDNYTGRLYSFVVNPGGPVTPPPPPSDPVDAVVSDWSPWVEGEWSACVDGVQTRLDSRIRTVVVPAQNGGVTPSLIDTRTVTQSCVIDPPPPTPVDAVVSEWSDWVDVGEWSECVGGSQSKTQRRTRTVLIPAQNGGVTPQLIDEQTISRTCTVTTPPSELLGVVLEVEEITREVCTGRWWWRRCENIPTGEYRVVVRFDARPSLTPGQVISVE